MMSIMCGRRVETHLTGLAVCATQEEGNAIMLMLYRTIPPSHVTPRQGVRALLEEQGLLEGLP